MQSNNTVTQPEHDTLQNAMRIVGEKGGSMVMMNDEGNPVGLMLINPTAAKLVALAQQFATKEHQEREKEQRSRIILPKGVTMNNRGTKFNF
jgi:hypothetical protein